MFQGSTGRPTNNALRTGSASFSFLAVWVEAAEAIFVVAAAVVAVVDVSSDLGRPATNR